MKSVMTQGHTLSLYCYDRPDGVPEGVEVRDAAAILPEDRIVRHQGGSLALFSDWFRYELQRRGAGIWLDTDQYLLAPLAFDRPHLFGWSEPGKISIGVLRVPPDSPMLPALLAIFDEKAVPSWLPFRLRLAAELRLRKTGRTGLSLMPWGVAGPDAITAIAGKHGLSRHALKASVFYPVHWRDADWIKDPAIQLDDMIAPDTVGIHLWNELIQGYKDEPAPRGSFLARLQEEGGQAPALGGAFPRCAAFAS